MLVPGVDKGLGLRWLAEELELPLSQVAGIGDSPGDLAWLSLCGRSSAPANAEDRVRVRVDEVSEFEDLAAVVELYQRVVESNRRLKRTLPK